MPITGRSMSDHKSKEAILQAENYRAWLSEERKCLHRHTCTI